MNAVLHAMGQVNPVHFGKGRIISHCTDRDNLVFDECGRMVIGSDGLPKVLGLPLERKGYRKNVRRTNTKSPTCASKILEQLKKTDELNVRELSSLIECSISAVNTAIRKLQLSGEVEMEWRNTNKFRERFYRIA